MEKRAMYCLYTFGITLRRPSYSHSPSHRPSNSTSPDPSTRCTTLVGAATRDRQQQQHPSTDPNLQAAGGIRVLWVSWCDAVIAVCSDDDYDYDDDDAGRNDGKKEGGKWRLTYSGTGLTPSQQAGLRGDDKRVLRAVQEYQREGGEAGGEEKNEIVFFGGKMHHGLQGYVVSTKEDDGDEEQDVVIFGTEDEMLDKSVLETQTYRYSNNESGSGGGRIVGIEVLPNNSILVFLQQQQQQQQRERHGNTTILQLQDISHLREWLLSSRSSSTTATISSPQPQPSTALPLRFHIKYTATNAATTTLLDTKHRVWTCFNSPSDTRYTACLGRQPDYDDYDDYEDDDDDDSEQINPHANDYSGEQHNGVIAPSVVVVEASATLRLARIRYLEETRVTRVVSGGYMSGALSEQGELYIWGAACPGGGSGEIFLLRRGDDEDDEEEQDEFVKVVDVRIHGAEASVYDVAIGHGHVLVAAECGGERAVFAAGDNSRGQLGMDGGDFYNAFREVVALRGKRVVQLCAAGWSSYVVTLEE